jgi:hypothetical protein
MGVGLVQRCHIILPIQRVISSLVILIVLSATRRMDSPSQQPSQQLDLHVISLQHVAATGYPQCIGV